MVEKDFFVGIYEPQDVRRNVLESSHELVSSMQAHERLEELRKHKLRHYDSMRKLMEELDFLISKLRTKLPKTAVRKTVEANSAKIEEKMLPEIDRLDAALKKLEKNVPDK